MSSKLIISILIVVFILLAFVLGCTPSPQKTITLKLISFVPKDNFTVAGGWPLIDKVNERAKGELVIDWVGGPEVVAGFDQGKAVQSGSIDMAIVPASYYGGLIPGIPIKYWDISDATPIEERQSGYYDWLVELHKEHVNAYYIGSPSQHIGGYPMITNFRVDTPQDLKGRKITITPQLEPFSKALGMTPVMMSAAERYEALERKVVDATALPLPFCRDARLFEVTDYLIDYAFYEGSDMPVIMNLDKWNSLPKRLQKLIIDAEIEVEEDWVQGAFQAEYEDARQKFQENGVEFIKFSDEDGKRFLDLAYSSVWEQVKKDTKNPKDFEKLQKYWVIKGK